MVYFFIKFKGNTAAGFGVDQSQFIRDAYVTAEQGPFVYLIYRLLHGIFKIASYFSSRLPYISQIKSCYRLEDSKYTVTWKANMWCTIKKCHVHGFYIIYLQKISKKQYKPSCGWGLIIVNSSLGTHCLLLKCLINFPVNLCQLLICLITKMMSTVVIYAIFL